MNSLSQVDEIIRQVKGSGITMSEAVWQTAIACEGWPYVFGAWGQKCTPNNRRAQKKADISGCQVLNGSKASCAGCKWNLPVRMFDCRGFTGWCLEQFGIKISRTGATSQWNGDYWVAKGTIDTIPEDVLVCLFYPDSEDKSKMAHTGFGYKGQTCECSKGVQHFDKRKSKWTHWAIPKGIDGTVPEYKPTLRRGDKGEWVTVLQTKLSTLGYSLGPCGIDGDYGKATQAAVRQFQMDKGLTQDGVCGPKTWEALDNGPDTKLYTVHIPFLTKSKAEAIIAQYSGSWMTNE